MLLILNFSLHFLLKGFWSWDEIMNLNIEDVAAQRSFVFLWCGSSDGLDLGKI